MAIPREYQEEAIESVISYYDEGGKEDILACMPTGTGKSIVLAEIVRRVMMKYPSFRFVVVTHVKELIEQNHAKMLEQWHDCPVGINNADLRRRDTAHPVIFGSVQSMAKSADLLGHRDVMLIDEAHLVGDNPGSQYLKFIEALRAINPAMKIIGLTATAFRMGMGMLTDGPIFDKIRYNLCGVNSFNRLVEAGFLSPLIPRPTDTTIDVQGVKISGGDFNGRQLQQVADVDETTFAAMREMVEKAHDRRSWLVFTSGVEHAESAANALRHYGVEAVAVHSKLKKHLRNERIEDFKAGRIRCLVTNNMLTTGFDHPYIDAIGVLRPTLSPGLWVQILGRGVRIAPGKLNCLVLDFAKNTPRLGPINDPRIPNKPGESKGEIPLKICPACSLYNHSGARFCGGGSNSDIAIGMGGCGFEFVFESKYYAVAGDEELIRQNEKSTEPDIQTFPVTHVFYGAHQKRGKQKPTLKITYVTGINSYKEYIPIEVHGPLRDQAMIWWGQRSYDPLPKTVDETIKMLDYCRQPKSISVDVNSKHNTITAYNF